MPISTGRMSGYTWADIIHLPHKVRNLTRRGYLLKTYNDGKILKARVKTGDGIENDKIDVVHPVGYVSHVKASKKTEVITLDIGGDSSRRVALAVIGDREYHPQPDEGEAFYYAPGDKKIFLRVKMAGDQQSRADGGDGGGSNDSGRPAGIHMDGSDQVISAKTTKSFSVEATEGINMKTDKHIFEGDVLIKGNLDVTKDLRISDEGYKPGDGPWADGHAEGAAASLAQAVAHGPALADLIKLEDGVVTIAGDLYIEGDLHVDGVVTAKDFVRVEG